MDRANKYSNSRLIPALCACGCILIAAAIGASADQPTTQATDQDDYSFLNRSFEVEESIEKARRQQSAREWDRAAIILQVIAERQGEFVVRSSEHSFVSAADFVHRMIADGPVDGLAAYRRLYERSARARLDAARTSSDETELLEVGERFFPTESGAVAIDEAAQRAIRRGEFAAAARWYQRLIDEHPDRSYLATQWRVKQSLARALDVGDASPLIELRRTLPAADSQQTVAWSGTDQSLSKFLDRAAKYLSPPAQPGMNGETGIFTGSFMRGATFQCEARFEAQLWRFPLANRRTSERAWDGYESPTARQDAKLRALQSGRMLGISPVAADGLIFMHDDQAVWAVDPDKTDSVAWRYDLGEDTSPNQSIPSEDEPPPQYTTLATDGRLLAHLERPLAEPDNSQIQSSSCLVCLDQQTGRLIWRNDLVEFAKPFEQTKVDGAGVYQDGAYFVVVRRQKPFGFEACHLLKLDAETGMVKWSAHLGEAATGTYGYSRATLSHPALAGDLVIVASNLGTIAAVQTSNGRIAWLTTYPSKYATAANSDGLWTERPTTPAKAWNYPAPIVWRDLVIVMPLDAERLYLLSRNDGAVRREETLESIGSPQALLGCHGDLLYTVGSNVLAYDIRSHRIAWQRPLAAGRLIGAGAIGSGGVFIPTDQALLRYPLDGGPAQQRPWSIEQAGNVLLLPDQVVVASPDLLYALIDEQKAFDRWTRRVRDNPSDAEAPLYLAELALSAGDYPRGLDAVREAVRRMGGFAAIVEDTQRSKLFNKLMTFVDDLQKVADPREAKARVDTTIRLLQFAGNCAPGYLEQVEYRLRLAGALEAANRSIEAVSACQQILSDRTLRGVRLKSSPLLQPPGEEIAQDLLEGEPQTEASSLARQWIARIIKLHGPKVYDAVEKTAQQRLQLAVAKADADAVLEVADSHPNSRAAKMAMSAHARMMVAKSRWADARRSYRRAVADATDPARPELIREFAGSLLAEGRTREAAAWLDRAVRDYPNTEIRHDGQLMGFTTLREQLLRDKSADDPSHSQIGWPVSEGYRRLHPDRVSILEPTFAALPDTSWDALISFSHGQIEARNPVTGRALWPAPMDCPVQPTLLGMDQTRLVFSTQFRIFALTRTSGQLAWEFGQEPPADPSLEPEASAAWTAHWMTSTRVYCASDRGEVLCLELSEGRPRWRRTLDNQLSGQLVADESYVYLPTWQGRNHGLVILDAGTGEVHKSIALGDGWPIQGLLPTTEGVVLAVFANMVNAIDPDSGKTLWHAVTADRLNLSTLQIDENGIYASRDGRRITMYQLADGQAAWTSPPVTRNEADGLWVQVSSGVLYTVGSDTITAFDTATGRQLWSIDQATDLRAAPPRIMEGSLLTISREGRTAEDSRKPKGDERPRKSKYVIRRNRLSDGREQPLVGDASLSFGPTDAFGGIYPRDGALIVLDASTIIGYVSKR
jgi:outer membrane protein assembly factor BamB